ncbi:hypothetical protein [Dermatobacter hominis]|uniref:hypothetical protein n=1 Tax=Dermatobacter hominis TaxID=2884263 RepID=UPI001D10C6A9|nr:hypothetical protein [Dermatobacter hominis]UDY33935.1 hypothetical protein LH044_11315 [Dermatobacter hominis]
MSGAGRTVRRDPRVLWRRVHDGVLLLAPGATTPVLASGAAGTVWLLLGEAGASSAELVRAATAAGPPEGAPVDGGVGAAVELLVGAGVAILDVDGDAA